MPIFLEIRPAMFRHALDQIIDEFLRYERVAEIQLSHIWL